VPPPSHPLAVTATVRIHNPSAFTMNNLGALKGSLHLEGYNYKFNRPDTAAMPAHVAVAHSPRFGSFEMPDTFTAPRGASNWTKVSWPLHDIAITNSVWCTAYTRGVGGGAYIAQWPCISIAIGYVLQVGGRHKRMMDFHNKALK